ncbi:MAG: signal recognition particle-docking protein FtsY [Pseudomonadota bacterium]|nr:signal recognition particle-docking protein FtsY [Pseudomonadota bacterium]
MENNFMVFGFLKKSINKKTQPHQQNSKDQNKIKESFGSLFDSITSLYKADKLGKELEKEIKKNLIETDMGAELTHEVLEELKKDLSKKATPELVRKSLYKILLEILSPCDPPSLAIPEKPYTILMVGINGAGKTTTCGKIAHQLSTEKKSVTLAAGDTYRAAAIEQLQEWGKRANCKVVSQKQGSDSASVIHDAMCSAKSNHCDYLIADTSGRLHTQDNLMRELLKIKKVMSKQDPNSPHEIWLVLDASLGQNNIQQAETFKNEIGITGIILTKLDGSGKGGSIFTIAKKLKLPIRYIGIGESPSDLKPFNSKDFIENILS